MSKNRAQYLQSIYSMSDASQFKFLFYSDKLNLPAFIGTSVKIHRQSFAGVNAC